MYFKLFNECINFKNLAPTTMTNQIQGSCKICKDQNWSDKKRREAGAGLVAIMQRSFEKAPVMQRCIEKSPPNWLN